MAGAGKGGGWPRGTGPSPSSGAPAATPSAAPSEVPRAAPAAERGDAFEPPGSVGMVERGGEPGAPPPPSEEWQCTEQVWRLLSDRSLGARADRLRQAARLVLDIGRPEVASGLLRTLHRQTRIADIYPLELEAYLVERRAEWFGEHRWGLLKNLDEVSASIWAPGAPIPLAVDLRARVTGFALDGGGAPGYALYPGDPATYWLEIDRPGSFPCLLKGSIQGKTRLERFLVVIADSQGSTDGARVP